MGFNKHSETGGEITEKGGQLFEYLRHGKRAETGVLSARSACVYVCVSVRERVVVKKLLRKRDREIERD